MNRRTAVRNVALSREGAMKAAERWAEKLGGGKRLEIIISGER